MSRRPSSDGVTPRGGARRATSARGRRRCLRHLLGFGLGVLALGEARSRAPSPAADTAVVEVVIEQFRFDPPVLTVRQGTTVRWVNRERRTHHSVIFNGEGQPASDLLFPGDTWSRQMNTPGTHPYFCGPHPEMKGVVEVQP